MALHTDCRRPPHGASFQGHGLTTSMQEVTNLERITPPELGFNIVTPGPLHLSKGTRL